MSSFDEFSLTINEQFYIFIIARTSYTSMWWSWYPLFTRSTPLFKLHSSL